VAPPQVISGANGREAALIVAYPASSPQDQATTDLAQLRLLGAGTVVFDPFNGDPDETHHPEAAWYALAAISARVRHLREQP
jgi:hypothetical protein